MPTTTESLYSENPVNRLNAARNISKSAALKIQKEVGAGAPYSPWPYGMPTSVNPYVLCLGISPGARRNDDSCDPYPLPTIGSPHEGFGGECVPDGCGAWDSPYWEKVRELCVGIVQEFSPSLNRFDCLSLAGHLNLGTGQDGVGREGLIEPKVAKWIPRVITERLKPRILICFGLWKLYSSETLRKAWAQTSLEKLIKEEPVIQDEFAFSSRTYRFRLSQIQYGEEMQPITVLLWPNHPSRHPFAGGAESDAWKASITQGKRLLKKWPLLRR